MKYREVVKKAQAARKKPYGKGKVQYKPCKTWLAGDQINLWTYWQGYQLKDIDEKGVDVLLVGQDWGNPFLDKNVDLLARIKRMQDGDETACYNVKLSETDRNLVKMFKAFGKDIDISKKDPGMRLFFMNYSLGYRIGNESGGMTDELMKVDEEFFNDLVLAIKPKIIICLGQCVYEAVSDEKTADFCKRLRNGKPFETPFPLKPDIMVYGVAHCGSRGRQNVGGLENMQKAWDFIAREYKAKYAQRRNTIQAEQELAKEKMLETVAFSGNELVVLSRDNVAKVEAMIRNDSDYLQSSNKDAKPIYGKDGAVKYAGSSAYWFSQLKDALLSEKKVTAKAYRKIVAGAVEAVDRENSTHLNSDCCGREEIIERVCQMKQSELLECLRNPDYEEMKLFREIARKTAAEHKARTNLSFASKFCHYACFWVFEGTEYQDNYVIYDSILRKVIPLYLEYFKIKQDFDLKDYGQYRKAVDSIREAAGVEISRNGFDHLLWYYHKGRV